MVYDAPASRDALEPSVAQPRSLSHDDSRTMSETPAEDDYSDEKIFQRSTSHWEPEPGFSHLDGDVDGNGYNDTFADIVIVPCIGASPLDTWSRVPFDDGYFEIVPSQAEMSRYQTIRELPASSILSPGLNRHLPKAAHSWVRQGIRKAVNTARVMPYRHREPHSGYTFHTAADDLLQQLAKIRAGSKPSRPIFFICHSIGGIVAKLALVKASQMEEYRWLIYACHGITFFATPHRGSSYLSMRNLRESIMHLLFLQKPLPRSITDELRLGHKPLLEIHDQFLDIASEMRIWTFCETIDSQLSGLGTSDRDEVHFSAPIASIKSSLTNVRAESVFSLESDHAHCASFGPENVRIMHTYLTNFGEAVRKAQRLSETFEHTPLRLDENVKLELIGFYEDPDGTTDRDIRLYIVKHNIAHFLEIGPERCLKERLESVAAKPRRVSDARLQQLATTQGSGFDVSVPMKIFNNVQHFGQKIFGATESQFDVETSTGTTSPAILVTDPLERPSMSESLSDPAPLPTAMRSRKRGLTVPGLSLPDFFRSSSQERQLALQDPISPFAEDEASSSMNSEAKLSRLEPHDQAHASGEGSRPSSLGSSQSGLHKSKTADVQEMTAGFTRPDPNKRKFMWIHLAFNNPYWVKLILDKLVEGRDDSNPQLLDNQHWTNKHVKNRHANQHASYVKPGCAFALSESQTLTQPTTGPAKDSNRLSGASPLSHLYVYMPYLNFDTYLNIIRRRNIVRRRMAQGRARPVPPDIAELESLEARVIWDYIGHDPPLNARRTLDQYGYPELQDTYARDDDQMLYKLTKERFRVPFLRKDMYNTGAEKPTIDSSSAPRRNNLRSSALPVTPSTPARNNGGLSPSSGDEGASIFEDLDAEENVLDGNVLMVDQLWLWAIDTSTLSTFFPKRESHPSEGQMFQQADLRNSVYNELNGDLTGRCDNALELAAFVVLHAITVLLNRTSHPDLEVFRIFEEALGILNERMTSSLKRFRLTTFRGRTGEDPASSDSESDGTDDRPESIKKRHRREMEQAERENRDNTSALLELRDMDDELLTMNNLFDEQSKVVDTMKSNFERPELLSLTVNGRAYLEEALEQLDGYRRTTRDLLARIDATRNDYDKFQEMVQRKAQLDEVRWSRLQTELASSQNLSVMIFTTFTVIFLPLSFFTSLFGMNASDWAAEEDLPSLKTIGFISVPSSFLLILLSLILAFSTRVQSWFKAFFHVLSSIVKFVVLSLARVEPRQRRRARQSARAEAERLRRDQRRQRKRERGYDFWETVWENRRSRYDIPDSNLRTATEDEERRMRGRLGTWASNLS